VVNFLNYCYHLFVVSCCMFSIMQSPLLFFLLCGRWLLFGRLLRLVHLLVLLTSAQLVLFLFSLRQAFECILHDQVIEHVNGRNLLSGFQSGFRRGRSTVTVLVRVTEDLRSVKAERKVTVHVLRDVSKAFDLVNHGLFVHKLDSRYGFHMSAMSIFTLFLWDRSMVVEVDGVISAPRYLSSRVSQGCIPSLMFFSMLFLNSFFKDSFLCR
jgi:hypothetical protein